MPLQLTAKEANVSAAAVSAEACLAFPGFLASVAGVSAEAFGFPDFLPSEDSVASTVTTLSPSLASSASLGGAVSEAHLVIDHAKIFRSSPASDFPWRMATSVRKGGRRTELRDFHYRCFLEPLRLPAVARRRTSMIGRRFFLLQAQR